jgi:hypothetical protein
MNLHKHPEPVPYASQFAVLPFLAAVEGFIKEQTDSPFRITMHRIATWESQGYFQQLCTYFGTYPKDQSKVGRMFPVTTGIIGYAFDKKKIARTRKYSSKEALLADLREDMRDNRETQEPEEMPPAYLAVPFIGAGGEVVMVLFAECKEFNVFADDAVVRTINTMCHAYSNLLDWLQRNEVLPTIQNFPLEKGTPIRHDPTVYRRLQEVLDIAVPKFDLLTAFNYEVAVP